MKSNYLSKIGEKKGLILGGFLSDFFMILFVVLLLLIFFIGSSIIKAVDHSEAGIRVDKEKEIGLKGVDDYMKDYSKIVELKMRVADGETVETVLGGRK